VQIPAAWDEVRALPIEDRGHYTVYLPSYDDTRIIKMLKNFGHINWEVFSKHTNKCYVSGNVCVQPIENDKFIGSMASSKGVLCGAGFETPAEALFLKKKLAVIPMKMQYEQQCNAKALEEFNAMSVPKLDDDFPKHFKNWIEQFEPIKLTLSHSTEEIIRAVIHKAPSYSISSATITSTLSPLEMAI
jgi:uncharacterized protein (TIGR00661 family)